MYTSRMHTCPLRGHASFTTAWNADCDGRLDGRPAQLARSHLIGVHMTQVIHQWREMHDALCGFSMQPYMRTHVLH